MTPTQFELFYDRNASRAYGLARTMLDSELDAERTVQEAFLIVWNNSRATSGDSSETTWQCALMTAVRDLCCERLTCSMREGTLCARNNALGNLPADLRDVAELALCRGLSVREVATCLRIPAAEVRAKMLAGMRLLAGPSYPAQLQHGPAATA